MNGERQSSLLEVERGEKRHLIGRAALGLGLLIYVAFLANNRQVAEMAISCRSLAVVIGIGFLLSVVPVALKGLSKDQKRRTGMVGDFLMIAGGMLAEQHVLAPAYVLMLWVTISGGLRYGRSYLVLGVGLSVVAFAAVFALSPFWQSIYWLAAGLWVGLAAIPAYFWAVSTALGNARDSAERADRAKGRFLANMSHEFRTPLNGIQGMADLMAGCDIPVEARGYLEGIQSSTKGLGGLVQHLLDFAAIEAGKIRVSPDVFRVSTVVERVMATVRPTLLQKGIEERVCIAENVPPEVFGDGEHARRALLSLVCNAAKFTERGRVEVHVGLQHRGDAQKMLCFRVRDTGPGFSEQIGWKLFEPFQQADDSLSRATEGTGLGTAIAKGLVEANGGEIGFKSTPGVGSEFWFTFTVGAVPKELQGRNTAAPDTSAPTAGRPLRILVVDDHLSNRVVAEAILKKAGHRPVSVESGSLAIDLLSKEWVDMALLDLHMPGLSGLEVTKWIRAREQARSLDVMPVMLLTADGTEKARNDALAAGVTGVLTKPISMIDLVRHVGNVGATEPVLAGTSATKKAAIGCFLTELRESMDNDSAFLSYLDSGIKDATNCMGQLRHALRSNDLDHAANSAHALKGVSSNLGLDAVAKLSSEIEQTCRRHEAPGHPFHETMGQLHHLFEDGVRHIDARFRQGLKKAG